MKKGDKAFNAAVLSLEREKLVELCTDLAREQVRGLSFRGLVVDAVTHGHDPISTKLLVVILAAVELAKKYGKVAHATRRGESTSMHRAKLSMAMATAWENVRDEYVRRRVCYENAVRDNGRPKWRVERGRVVLAHDPLEDACE